MVSIMAYEIFSAETFYALHFGYHVYIQLLSSPLVQRS
jgi:hypothetical protein